MTMQNLVKQYADTEAPTAQPQQARRSSQYETAGESIARMDVKGTISVRIVTADEDGGTLGTIDFVIADVGGKFLLGDACRSYFYQINSLSRLIDNQRTSLDKMLNTDRSDEEHDDRIASLTATILRNEDNFGQYQQAFEQATKAYTAYCGDLWTPPAGKADERHKFNTAARLEAKKALEDLAKKRPVRQTTARPVKQGSAADSAKGFFARIFGKK